MWSSFTKQDGQRAGPDFEAPGAIVVVYPQHAQRKSPKSGTGISARAAAAALAAAVFESGLGGLGTLGALGTLAALVDAFFVLAAATGLSLEVLGALAAAPTASAIFA